MEILLSVFLAIILVFGLLFPKKLTNILTIKNSLKSKPQTINEKPKNLYGMRESGKIFSGDKIEVIKIEAKDGNGLLVELGYKLKIFNINFILEPIIKDGKENKSGITYEEACDFASKLKSSGISIENRTILLTTDKEIERNYIVVKNYFHLEKVLCRLDDFQDAKIFNTFEEAHKYRLSRSVSVLEEIKKTY